jgi:hypothetical protein
MNNLFRRATEVLDRSQALQAAFLRAMAERQLIRLYRDVSNTVWQLSQLPADQNAPGIEGIAEAEAARAEIRRLLSTATHPRR